MYRIGLVFLVVSLTLSSPTVEAQYFGFSPQPDSFAIDVLSNLAGIESEAADKVAYDFRNAWDAQLTNAQKGSIIAIATKMKDRRMRTRPNFEYFFSLITYALTQEGANPDEFTNLLEICHHAVDFYDKDDLKAFFKTLTFFFARQHLFYSHYSKLTGAGGSYSIELLDDAVAAPKPLIPVEDEAVFEEESDIISEEEFADDYTEITASDDESADDGWGSDDDWGADDGWGSDDGWGASDGGFIEDTSGDNDITKPAIEVFKRPHFEVEKIDLVAQLKVEDIDPPLHGPVFHITGMDLQMATPYDTITIQNASGTFMIKDQVFVGNAGSFDWPDHLSGTDGAVVHLEGYSFKTNVPYIKTTRAKMVFPKMFADSVAGVFAFKSFKRKNGTKRGYPSFIAHQAETQLVMPGDNMKFVGGFGLIGNQKIATAISKKPSRLTITDGRGRTVESSAIKYTLEDSVIRSRRSVLTLHHGEDSIYHPVVQFDYNSSSKKLILLKDQGDFKHTYYFSSFFRMEFKADMIEWYLDADSLDVSILNARNRIPAVFESEEYFNPIRFEKMSGLFGFHPIMAVVQYARKVQDSEFNMLELQETYEIDPKRMNSAILFLQQNGYIAYDPETGDIKILRKAFHYLLAYNKKKDYDNILISSFSPESANATLNFETGEMHVRGVSKIFITPDLDVSVTPDNKLITLLKDKGIKFNGMVNAGDFQYKGHEFEFDYDKYLIEMPVIDSIRIQVGDSIDHGKTALNNHLTQTSGTLYLNDPKNKAGLRKYVQYPYFVSDSDAIVYFSSPNILNNAYDSSVYFIIPPFEMDSINQEDISGIGFEGTFYSGGILPPIEERLVIMPDRSLGFEHVLAQEGYQLYRGEGTLYDSITLNADGLRAKGRIEYRTTTIHSNDFIFYMDSVSAISQGGVIREGQVEDASYPEAVLGRLIMKWLPLKDSMYVDNIEDSFDFYNATASLDGEANITSRGVFGSGVMLSRGSRTESEEYQFQQFEYSSRHAKFEILTNNPDKPAMAGDDISLQFDLIDNIADVQPEQEGVAAISFPYAQMKTSITNATWYLDSAKIKMSKPEEVDIESSYFYTTREELDSLAFNATGAVYDINTYELTIQGIPYIKVADAQIIPDNNETTILENATLQPFNNARVTIDTLNQYHRLFDGNITIISRTKFEGSATYELVNSAADTFAIKFNEFQFKGFLVGKNEYDSMTVADGTVTEDLRMLVSPGFFFKGDVTMYADRKALDMRGLIKPNITSLGEYDYWIKYENPGDTTEVIVDINTARTSEDQPVVAGLLYDNVSNHVYMAYLHDRKRLEDEYLFKAEGTLHYDYETMEFAIESPEKTNQSSYAGKSFIYNDLSKKLIFEGPIDFIKNTPDYNLKTTMLGIATPDSNQYFMDAMLAFDINIHPTLINTMSLDIMDIVERLGADVAHLNSIELIYKLADMIGDTPAKNYENGTLNDYVPLISSSPQMNKTLVISNVDLNWSNNHRAWYNTSPIGLSNIKINDINATVDGFLEIKKNDDGSDFVSLFIQVAPTTWYYFGYNDHLLAMFSSNDDFNALVTENSTLSKTGFGGFSTVIGDEFEVMHFINEYRKNYFGITEPYDLEFPDTTHLEDESFDTIEEAVEEEALEEATDDEEEEDDGF